MSGIAALEGSLPLRGRWHGVLRAEAAIGRSLFEADELPAGYTVRPARRGGIALGIARRW